MSIWTIFAFVLGLYAGSYIPNRIRDAFENFLASFVTKKKPTQTTPQPSQSLPTAK